MDTQTARAGFTNFTRVKELFEQAQAIGAPQRDAWLRQVCAGDPILLAELRGLLEANVDSVPPPGARRGPAAGLPESIGPYRLSRELGRGGMGVVYLAMRDDGAFRKNVALKLLLREQVNQEFVLRFKQERQVVAALDHPNIARILDGGETQDGMPYYVMEYVEGMALDAYCNQQRLSLTGRIKIFQQVCHAVHYLHQNLIVHRDLKPNNILVSSEGVVKLLDFGIAKVVGAASLSAQELTSAQGRPMTPAYASPEQIQGATLQKTSDIYSLGVILYLLLTGRQPYAGFDEKVEQLASRKDPPLPSANIREDLRAAPESTAQLRRALMGEIDSIVLMSMRFNPKERYQSAADLAGDLQSFLDGQAVTAHHASVASRSMKLLKRKRAAVAILCGFLLLAAFGGWQLRRVEVQKAEVAARQHELQALLEQMESKGGLSAPESLRDVRQLKNAFLTKFTAAVAGHPGPSAERDALLDRGVRFLDRVSKSSPPSAELELAIADGYQQLALLQEQTSRADARNREVAVGAYKKAVGVLSGFYSHNPNDNDAQRRLVQLNEHIRVLGGAPVIEPPAEPKPEPPLAVSKSPQPIRQGRSDVPPPGLAPSNATPQPPPPDEPRLSPTLRAELEDRLNLVETNVQAADQAVDPIRRGLESTGQTLNANTAAAVALMHTKLDRAVREIAAGEAAAAKENLAAADALAARLLKSLRP